MLREIAECPYCRGNLAVLDDVRLQVRFGDFHTRAEPCRHVAFACVALTAQSVPRHKNPPPQCSRIWFWVRGRGWRRLAPDRYNRLYDYVVGISCDLLAERERPPQTRHVVVGAGAMERENEQPGSGQVTWMVPGIKGAIDGLFDGYAIYSRKPEALIAEVKRLAGVSVRTAR